MQDKHESAGQQEVVFWLDGELEGVQEAVTAKMGDELEQEWIMGIFDKGGCHK